MTAGRAATNQTWHTIYARLPNWLARRFHLIPILSSKYVWSFLIFSLPVIILFNATFFKAWKPLADNIPVLVAIYVGSFWLWLAPILTLAWEAAYDNFVGEVRAYATRHQVEISRFESTRQFWRILPLFFGTSYILLGLFLHLSYRPLLSDLVEIPDGSAVFYITNLVLIIAGYVTGVGVAGVLQTILLYKSLSHMKFRWEPFHPDQRGGLAFLSAFALTTSTLFLGGVTVVPAMMSVAIKVQGAEALVGYGAVIFYAVFVAAIFFWPMSIVAGKATIEKESFLVGLSRLITDELEKVLPQPMPPADSSNPYINPSTSQLIDLYDRIKRVSVQPYSRLTLVRIMGNTLLPILLAIGQVLIEASGVLQKFFSIH